ncbi:pyrophosphate--fructose-6-phosphate 1-phosphotransferase [Boudabousia marimammalium]|uniref:Pyrophosphate--fructose 6-phosphate 1-phosphotransferase n=1 Tax=Boudabousia marimammalium TaxID=156892 RepID=A0A1Q5PR73_9ACTO|nr:pyrophosphate--fructose-6-phosphate 1-phosphotransferase [Boudabousia marimammalium]OKL49935.1 pyrophosphate--fructose-6-phosphate 1-phosphotransferase [Boudabousia marimammalium]
MTVRRVALLTAGGFAPCLSSAIGGLIERYTEIAPEVEIIAYQNGYHGLLTGNFVVVDETARKHADVLHRFGGSCIGNSRVKLTNAEDLIKRGLVQEGDNPLEVAAKQLEKDGVDVLHTIGGDDTNTTAADLAAYLAEHNYNLTVVGLPKTIDNDVVPIRQSLGAWTAAEQASVFAQNVIGEHRSNPRMLIVHEVMGRNCGWLTAASSLAYRKWLDTQEWVPSIGLSRERWDIHAVFVPEMKIDIDAEAARLRAIMDAQGNVNIFLSEGAGVPEIIAEMEESGMEVPRDPFGHVKLDRINPGQWFANQFAELIGAEKVMVQKSGYFSRSARANADDLRLIKSMTDLAVQCAFERTSGVVGHDEEDNNRLKAVPFERIAGGKPFNIMEPWFQDMMANIGQTVEPAETVAGH